MLPGTQIVPLDRPAGPPAPVVEVDLMAAFLSGRNRRTLRAYAGDLTDFARFIGQATAATAVEFLVSLPPGQANAAALAYRAHLLDRRLSSATIARRLAALRSMVKLARTLGRITWALDVESPRVVAYRDCRGPSEAEWDKMLAAAEGRSDSPKGRRDVALLWLLYGRGLRRGEVVALDLADGDLSPEAPAVEVLGKGRTDKERLTIAEPTRVALARWVEARGRRPGPLFGPLDPGAEPQARLTGEAVRRIIHALARRAGLARAVRPHGLRHAAITHALDSGVDMRDAAQFSRHADIRTLRIYDDRRRDVGGEVARRLAERARVRKGGLSHPATA
jgi:integrase/recombinase XerC